MPVLQVNGEFKQNGNTEAMITRIPGLIQHVSSVMTLEVRSYYPVSSIYAKFSQQCCNAQEGDLLLTGTPAGVGPVNVGDVVTVGLAEPDAAESISELEFTAVEREGGYEFTGGA